MDRNQALWAALKLRSDLAQVAILPAEEVRSTGAFLGFDDKGLLAAVTKLSEEGLVRLQGGGGVEVLEPKPSTTGAPTTAGPVFSGTFLGSFGYNTGSAAMFDQRGGGQGGTYNEAGAPPDKLEEIVGGLAAAAADLRARAAGLPAEEAAQVQAVADAAGEVARGAQENAPDKSTLIDRLKSLTAGAEEAGKLQTAVVKLGPALALLGTGARALLKYFGG